MFYSVTVGTQHKDVVWNIFPTIRPMLYAVYVAIAFMPTAFLARTLCVTSHLAVSVIGIQPHAVFESVVFATQFLVYPCPIFSSVCRHGHVFASFDGAFRSLMVHGEIILGGLALVNIIHLSRNARPFHIYMAINVNELTARMSALLQEDPDTPTAGGADWTLYLKYLNMAQHEWQEAYEWPSLYKEINTMTSQSTGNVTLSLPSDFRKADGFLKVSDGGVGSYAQIDPERRDQYAASDKYFSILGYPGSYSMIINPGSHGSGVSLTYSYWANAASLVSPTDVSLCPDPAFLVQRAVAYLWEVRDDGRFPQAKGESDKIMARMLEYEMTRGHSYSNRIQTLEESSFGFRIGRD